jgi:DNA-directed RNA polymerase specialized sigma24 family protein
MKEKSQQIIQLEEELLKGKSTEDKGLSTDSAFINTESAEPESIFGFRILTEEDWSRFKKYFDKVFPGKIQQLREIYPEITSAEQRIFMLIRLKTESKEIAGMLAISPESVRKTKYRLKKKLRLNEEDSLDTFINQF